MPCVRYEYLLSISGNTFVEVAANSFKTNQSLHEISIYLFTTANNINDVVHMSTTCFKVKTLIQQIFCGFFFHNKTVRLR